jgi:hypothetical protein
MSTFTSRQSRCKLAGEMVPMDASQGEGKLATCASRAGS